MILDTSALLAIVFQEPGYEDPLLQIEEAPGIAAGPPTLAETGILLLAQLAGEPLLFVGEDLPRTDLERL